MLVRVARPTDIPVDSLHGRKEDTGRSIRLRVRAVLNAAALTYVAATLQALLTLLYYVLAYSSRRD